MAAQRGRKKQLSEANTALLKAVQFATSIQKGTGLTDRQTHCLIWNGYVVATNDVVIIGLPIVGLSINCAPNSKILIAALERCESEVVFTLDGSTLIVKSGKVRVPVPCLDASALLDLAPDDRQGDASPALALALGRVAAIVDDGDDRPHARAVFMGANMAQGTHKGHMAVQVWHGVTPLPDLALPKESAVAISKHESELTGLGLSTGTATFWFANDSFIRTCLFDVKCPNYDSIFEQKIVAEPVPFGADFFPAVKMVLPFTNEKLGGGDTNVVTFEENKVWAGYDCSDSNASYDYPKCPIEKFTVNAVYLLMFESMGETFVLDEFQCKMHIYGKNVRGAIMGRRRQ